MKKSVDWLAALAQQGLNVRSARDAMQVRGWLDTGNYALNWAISGQLLRGYPLGHTTEIFGDPSTGKSFLVARALAMVQAAGGVALLDDTEHAYNLEHVARLGVDVERLACAGSHTVQDHLRVALAFIKTLRAMKPPVPAVLACDSLAQLSTEHELKELDKRDMTKAVELKKFFRVISGELFDLPAAHISANHTIANIGNMFQSRTTPGGGGPKFAASVRLDLRAVSRIKDTPASYSGVICTVVVDKNRLAPPWKKVQLAIPFARPISRASGLVPLFLELGVLEERGQFLFRDGQKLGRTLKAKERFLDQDEAGEQLLDRWPELLEETDAALVAGTLGRAVPPQTEEVPPDETAGP